MPNGLDKALVAIVGVCVVIGLTVFLLSPKHKLFDLSTPPQSAIEFTVSSTNDDQPVVTFVENTVDYKLYPFLTIRVDELIPSKLSQDPQWVSTLQNCVWSIKYESIMAETKGAELKTLTYGQAPQGYRVTYGPVPLSVGHFYRVAGTQVIRKLGQRQYEVIPYSKFLEGVKSGQFKDAAS